MSNATGGGLGSGAVSPSAANGRPVTIKKPDGLPPSINPGQQSQTLCRNILIHGYCKFEHKGCIFRHDTSPSKSVSAASPVKPDLKKRLNVESPTFTPGGASGVPAGAPKLSISPKAADAAPFVPRGAPAGAPAAAESPAANGFAAEAYAAKPAVTGQFVQDFGSLMADAAVSSPGRPALTPQQPQVSTPAYEYPPMSSYGQGSSDMFYHPQSASHFQPLQYHLYAPQPPHKVALQPYQRTAQSFFLSDNLREEQQRKSEASLQVLPSSNLPDNLHVYCSLVPLDTNADKSPRVFGHTSWIYKAFSTADGNTYALRRLEGFRLANEKAIATVQAWRRITSANVVSLFEAFTTRAFGDNSIIFVYDYHPLSSTLHETHFGPNARYPAMRTTGPSAAGGTGVAPGVPEQVLWSYLAQLTSALKIVHDAGLAARVMDPTKIILTSKMRVRLNCVGVLDVIAANDGTGPPTGDSLAKLQAEDIYNLGRLILSIACNSSMISTNAAGVTPAVLQKGLDFVDTFYSAELRNVLTALLNCRPAPAEPVGAGAATVKTAADLVVLMAAHLQQNMNSAFHYQDSLESELARELENGRLVRLLCKFGFINERPEYDHDPAWSETGDRYLLKLFRDYVFHQVDEKGDPVVDLAHVLKCLNKLDAGVDEKVMLVSRDEQSCLIVSYKELKNCIDGVFRDFAKASA
ncbi:uncharacterized protein V1510DRAFT_424207 [Dipodascopsis tothii]|uniref:uncharacterized protein n=1 Tax=Dipodascopsis tothii TaxID=44089 RepID=UPI0034CF47E8